MQGIAMTKDSALYYDDAYKDKLRKEVRLLAETFKNDTCLLAWGIGNEIDLGNANVGAAWSFVEELAQIINQLKNAIWYLRLLHTIRLLLTLLLNLLLHLTM